jgi:glucosamine-6-phosphate deaminase
MEIVILKDAAEVARAAAAVVARLVADDPTCVLGLATGRTPEPLYAELVRLHRESGLDFARVTTFNLDELVGADIYRRYMEEHFFRHVNLARERTHLPDGRAADVARACDNYEQAIRAAGGIDLQILGIGADGHIAFNEPSSSLTSRTRLKTLTAATAARVGVVDAHRHVLTMGIGTILEASRCLVLATGAEKADAVARMIEGPVTAFVPASALQLHPRTTVLVDEPAAGALRLAEYYREVWRGKPAWQRALDGI